MEEFTAHSYANGSSETTSTDLGVSLASIRGPQLCYLPDLDQVT